MKANRQKRHRQNTKRKNLETANYSDFDSAGQERIREQVLLSLKNRHCKIRHLPQLPVPFSPPPMGAKAAADPEVRHRTGVVYSSSTSQSWQLDLPSSL